MKLDRFEIFRGTDGGFWWRFRSKNGKVMSGSTEGFKTKGNARRSITKQHERERMALASPDGIEYVEAKAGINQAVDKDAG